METAEIGFGCPDEGEAFQKRHPKFMHYLQPLYDTMNKIFIREMESSGTSGPADRVVFYLGRLAVEDFNEILLLCGNGFGFGGMKILRGLYEGAVTLIYISENPDKAEDFLDYMHVHRRKFLNHAKDVFNLEELNLSANQAAEIQESYERVKDKFQVPDCKECGTTRINNSWSKLDTLSMARKTGIKDLYVPCFFQPTLQIHSTAISLCSRLTIRDGNGLSFIEGSQPAIVDFSMRCAHSLILSVLITVNDYFKMELQEEIEKRFEEFKIIWGEKKEQLSTTSVPTTD